MIDVTPEMSAAGMRAWDARHKAGIRAWPEMLAHVYRAMAAASPAPTKAKAVVPSPAPSLGQGRDEP